MEDQPPRRARVRVDLTAGDVGTMVRLGDMAPPPQPEPEPPPPITEPPPEETPQEAENKTLLAGALADAGVTPAPADTAAVAEIATLSPDTVATTARWIRRGKPQLPLPAPKP